MRWDGVGHKGIGAGRGGDIGAGWSRVFGGHDCFLREKGLSLQSHARWGWTVLDAGSSRLGQLPVAGVLL